MSRGKRTKRHNYRLTAAITERYGTVSRFAFHLGFSRARIYSYINGVLPNVSRAIYIAQELGMPVEDLFECEVIE